MVNAIIILQQKALLELHNRVSGKKEPGGSYVGGS